MQLRTLSFATRTLIAIALLTMPVIARSAPHPEESTSATLQPRLDSMKSQFMGRAPKETVDLYERAIKDLRTSGILERALKVSDTALDFSLPNANGDTVSLSHLLQQGPVVVTWYRGGWCPYCNLTLRAWREYLPSLLESGARLVAISPEVPDSSLSTKERLALEFEVLSDRDNRIGRQFGIVYKLPKSIQDSYSRFLSLSAYNGNEDYELPLAATYVIGTDRIIRFAFVDTDYKVRAEPSDVLGLVRKLHNH